MSPVRLTKARMTRLTDNETSLTSDGGQVFCLDCNKDYNKFITPLSRYCISMVSCHGKVVLKNIVESCAQNNKKTDDVQSLVLKQILLWPEAKHK